MYKLTPIERITLMKLTPSDTFDYTGLDPDKLRKKIYKQLQIELNDAYTANIPSKICEKFQHPKTSKIRVYDKSKMIYCFNGKIYKKKLRKLCARHPKATVMIDLGNGLFKSIGIKTFKKLIKIKFMLFETTYELCGVDDNDEDMICPSWWAPSTKLTEKIYSINHLLQVFTLEESHDKSVQKFLSSGLFTLSSSDRVCKILYKTGGVKVMEYKDFLKKYGLDMKIKSL